MAEPIKQMTVQELKKLKAQYKYLKEVKSRHITDMQGVLEIFGLLAVDKRNSLVGGSEQRDSNIPMDVKFEEETYEDEDWFLMLLSELLFDKLKLDRPEIALDKIPLQEQEDEVVKIMASGDD